MRWVHVLLVAVAVSLLGCPPVRENLPHADEFGGSYGDAFLTYRYYPNSAAWVVYLFLPREEEDFGCADATNYGWNDDDNEWLLVYMVRGEDMPWEGEYPSYYTPECEAYGNYNWLGAQCTSFFNGTDPEGNPLPDNRGAAEISRWDDNTVTGSLEYGTDIRETFRATNCGELPGYYYYAGRIGNPRPDTDLGGDKKAASAWRTLRFK